MSKGPKGNFLLQWGFWGNQKSVSGFLVGSVGPTHYKTTGHRVVVN